MAHRDLLFFTILVLLTYVQGSEDKTNPSATEGTNQPSTTDAARLPHEKTPFPKNPFEVRSQGPLPISLIDPNSDLSVERSRYNTFINIQGRPRRRYRYRYRPYYRTGESEPQELSLRQLQEQSEELNSLRDLEEPISERRREQLLIYLHRPRFPTFRPSSNFIRQLDSFDENEDITERRGWRQILSWIFGLRSLSSSNSSDQEQGPEELISELRQGDIEVVGNGEPFPAEVEGIEPFPMDSEDPEDEDPTYLLRGCAPGRNHSLCQYYCRLRGFGRGCVNTRNRCSCRR